MPTILLIRHGENQYVAKGRLAGRLPGVHLNDHGERQAKEVAKALTGLSIKAVYSSPMERCMETAQPLAKALEQKVYPRQGLIEVDFGKWQDKTLKELSQRKLWKVVQSNPSRMKFPKGETFSEAQQRIVQELEELAKSHAPKDLIACFSHSDLIKLAISYYLGQPLDLFQRIMIAPASVSTIHLGEMGAQIVNVNMSAAKRPFSHQKSKKKKSNKKNK
jgi:probable phosphoglycerate mutase